MFVRKTSASMHVKTPQEMLSPNPTSFAADPFGYSTAAWSKWVLAQNADGGLNLDPLKPPTGADLKDPVLWLLQARALTEAARVVIKSEPNMDNVPICVRGVLHCQYCAVGLMLVGYSLEVCLKAMLLLAKGVACYTLEEQKHKHHDLVRLADFVPDLSAKDKAMLRLLTYFVLWAGRYPDPGSGRESEVGSIFEMAEQHRIASPDLFDLAARIARHVQTLTA